MINISEGTILLISKVAEFWKTVNVQFYILIYNRAVASSLDHENLDKLIEISNFAKEIASKTSKRAKCLSKKTQKIVCCRHVMG